MGKREAWVIEGTKGDIVKYYKKIGCDSWSKDLGKAKLFDKEPKEKLLDALLEAWKFEQVVAVSVTVIIKTG